MQSSDSRVCEPESMLHLMSCVTCRQNQYMGFGLSGSDSSTEMVGSDATIAWIDSTTGTPNAQDYYLTARSPVSTELD